mgnify:CR=1 FL=1
MQEHKTIQSYLDAVAEQIRWKRARSIVTAELERHLEDQRAEEGDGRRHHAVTQGGEEGGAQDAEAREEEGGGVEEKAAAGQGVEPLVIAHEDPCQGPRHKLRSPGQHQGKGQQQGQAFFQDVFQLRMVLGAVVEAHDGRRSNGIADKHSNKDKSNVHDHAVSRHAVLSCQPQKLKIIGGVDHRG